MIRAIGCCCVFFALVAGLLSGCAPADRAEPPSEAGGAAPAYDLLISGGTVVDGSGEPAVQADLLIQDGRIAFVGPVDSDTIEAREHFDAAGLVVTPGFVDAHAHHAGFADPGFPNFLAMGVTTIVVGQDGGGHSVDSLPDHFAAVDAARPAVNVAYLVGHNTIRRESGVGFEEPGSEGLVRMSDLVAQGLEAGAFGLSTGLEYDPGSRSGPSELAAIAEPVAAAGGVVVSHMRTEDADGVQEALRELIEQGRQSGARVHVSHMKIVLGNEVTQADSILALMQAARDDGIEVTADVYPYTASYTGIGILFPEWARPPNDYDAVVRDRGAELADYLRARVNGRNGPDATLFGSGEWSGRTLAEVAEEQGRPFEHVLIELGPTDVDAAYFVMNEDVMGELLANRHVVVSSDGSPTMQHPRGYGSFARVIRQFVVEDNELALEEAVRKMSGATAAIYRLDDPVVVDLPRGLLREGWAADVLVFDPAEVRDVADFEQPHQLAQGIRAVWVNGERAWPAVGAGHGHVLKARW